MSITKIRMFIKYEDTHGVLIEDYPEFLLDLVSAPPHRTVSEIIFGNDDGVNCMIVHYEPLTDEELARSESWERNFDAYAETFSRHFDDISDVARKRWPNVRIFRVPGCLCCNGVEDLRQYDCEMKFLEPTSRPSHYIFGENVYYAEGL